MLQGKQDKETAEKDIIKAYKQAQGLGLNPVYRSLRKYQTNRSKALISQREEQTRPFSHEYFST